MLTTQLTHVAEGINDGEKEFDVVDVNPLDLVDNLGQIEEIVQDSSVQVAD